MVMINVLYIYNILYIYKTLYNMYTTKLDMDVYESMVKKFKEQGYSDIDHSYSHYLLNYYCTHTIGCIK